jgi:hypothetical protein
MTPSNSRVLVVSQRLVRPVVSNAGGYEFEDVVRTIDDVDLLAIETEEPDRFPLEQKVLSRIRKHTGIVAHREPRRKRAKVTKPYDLLFMRIMSPTQLDILQSVEVGKRTAEPRSAGSKSCGPIGLSTRNGCIR